MPLLSLPTDALCQIFKHCYPVARWTETCREFALVAHFTSSLWCEVNLGSRQFTAEGPKFLRARLGRTGKSPIKVSVVDSSGICEISTPIVDDILRALGEYNPQIDRIEISAQTALGAGHILSAIYSSTPSIFPDLKTLSVKVKEDPSRYSAIWPQLDIFLQRLLPSFPNLQSVAIPTQFACIPEINADSFSQLHTLIFDGTMEEEEPSMALIVGVLHHTPRLETLWLKSITRETTVGLADSTIPGSLKNAQDVPIPLSLPRLTHLAVTTPGSGSDLLLCIDAPALKDLHLDGSRGPRYQELTGNDLFWSPSDATCVADSLKRLARRSPDLARLALTSTYLDEDTWRWLLLGSGTEGPPFRSLESLALWDLGSSSKEVISGFNSDLLFQCSNSSGVLPRKISLRRCTFPLTGPALLHAYTNSIRNDATAPYMLEVGSSCTGITGHDIELLSQAGVVVSIRDDDDEKHEWWNQGHQIDASDSGVYSSQRPTSVHLYDTLGML